MAEGGRAGIFSKSRWGIGGSRTQAHTPLDGSNVDKKSLEKVQKLLEKLVKLCDNSQLGLKRSPPYLLDLLPHMFQTLQDIFKSYDSRISELNNNQYFRLFIDNVCNKLKRGIKLFRDNRNIFHENSTERKTLTRLSLHISHMLYELRALFPNSNYIGNEYRITKEEAAEFWKQHFGDRCIVSWKDFRTDLSATHPITSSYEAMALKSTIDLTHNDMVSVFEYDVFTRLFQPWDTLLINWKMIAVTHTGYQAFLTYGEVKERLNKWIHKPGTYIFRLSCTRLGQWAIGYVTDEHEILQTIPQNKSLCEALILGAQEGYYLFPDGKEQNPDLTVIQHEKQKKVIQVSEEEYEIYTSMGSTFQQCKICQENDKDVKLQPCAHLLCSECLFQWQEHDKSSELSCPFCRAPVKDYEQVEVDPFQRSRDLENGVSTRGINSLIPAPPIPDRLGRGQSSSVRHQQVSPGSNRHIPPSIPQPPPPSIPRRPGESNDPAPPSRPPPLPPMNSIPKPDSSTVQGPTLPCQPPPIFTSPPPSSYQSPQPPEPSHCTPGNDTVATSMSATNPFFSDVQALRSSVAPPPPSNNILIDPSHRTTRYTEEVIPGEQKLYNNVEVLPSDSSIFLEAGLESISPAGWGAGQFDNTVPVQELYCNVNSVKPEEEPPTSSLHPPDALPGASLINIALRPTSIIDPDTSLFDGSNAALFDNSTDDIYENQQHFPQESQDPDTLPVKERLIALGYSPDAVGRAMDIVGADYDMALKILQNFVR